MIRFFLVGVLAWLPASGLADARVILQWDADPVVAGDSVALELHGEGLEDVYGIQMELAFETGADEQQVEFGNPPVLAGTHWSAENDVELANRVEGRERVRWVFSLLRPSAPVSGAGELARIPLRMSKPGELSARVTELKLGTPGGEVTEPAVASARLLRVYASEDDFPQTDTELPRWWFVVGFAAVLLLGGLAFAGLRKSSRS